jgi:hypothetical protein
VKVQSAGTTDGVGPADSTGKSCVKDCPGGRRSATSVGGRLPKNPRVAMHRLALRFARSSKERNSPFLEREPEKSLAPNPFRAWSHRIRTELRDLGVA